jgi:hypothetical protein
MEQSAASVSGERRAESGRPRGQRGRGRGRGWVTSKHRTKKPPGLSRPSSATHHSLHAALETPSNRPKIQYSTGSPVHGPIHHLISILDFSRRSAT